MKIKKIARSPQKTKLVESKLNVKYETEALFVVLSLNVRRGSEKKSGHFNGSS